MPKCLCPHHKTFNKHVYPCGEALRRITALGDHGETIEALGGEK